VDALTARTLPVASGCSARAEHAALSDVIGAVARVDARGKRSLDATTRGGDLSLGEFVFHALFYAAAPRVVTPARLVEPPPAADGTA